MPAYNCRICKGIVDPTETIKCPSCDESKPLICSKCSSPINHHDIHEIGKLRVKKPLLCIGCGQDNKVVKCALCNLGVVRSQGATVSPLENAKVYHPKCLNKRKKSVEIANKIAPICAGAVLAVGGIFFVTADQKYGVGALVIGLILYFGIKLFTKIITPR